MIGRKPKPSYLKAIEGNPGKRPLNELEPKPNGNLVNPPAHLSASQIAIWNYAIANAPTGLLKNLDLGVLELWVVSFDLYRKAEALVRQEGPVTTAPSGYAAPHPGVSIMNKQASNMLRSAAEMGFTPSSRSRISVVADDIEDDPWAKLAAEG